MSISLFVGGGEGLPLSHLFYLSLSFTCQITSILIHQVILLLFFLFPYLFHLAREGMSELLCGCLSSESG